MLKRLTYLMLAGALFAAGCGDDDGNNATSNNATSNNATSNNSTSNNATSNNGTTPNGGTNPDANIHTGADFGREEVTAAEGATIEVASGRASIEIPAGALSADTEVVIRLNSTTSSHDEIFNNGMGPIPFTINLEPKGTVLSAPATLRFLVPIEDLAQSNMNGQIWQFGIFTNATGESTNHPATTSVVGEDIEVVAEVDTFDDYSPVGMGKIKLMPSCTTCTVGSPATLRVDVENILAPTIGFDLTVAPGDLTFASPEFTGGIAAPMTHELVDFDFQCDATGTSTVTVDFDANLGPDSGSFGFGAPIEAEITCQ